MAERGLEIANVRLLTGACLRHCQKRGVAKSVPGADVFKLWWLALEARYN